MADFEFVTDRLAVGAAVGDGSNVDALIAAGVTHIVDCQAEYDDTKDFASHTEVSVLWNPTQDDGQPKAPEWWDHGIEFALMALAKPHTKVYAHCAAGVNRGPSMCFGIMLALGFTPTDAEALIRAVRPQVGLAYKADAIAKVPALGY